VPIQFVSGSVSGQSERMQRPHGGQRYQSTSELSASGLTHWRAPFTGGFQCALPAGTVLVVVDDPLAHATAAGCRPERYAEFEEVLVPIEDRSHEKYDGYTLVIELDEFGRSLQLIE
jgi:hypothetical protein